MVLEAGIMIRIIRKLSEGGVDFNIIWKKLWW